MRGSVGCVGHERDHRAPTDLGQGKSPFSFCGNGFILISGSPGIVRRLKPKQLKPLCCECQRFLCLNVQLDMISTQRSLGRHLGIGSKLPAGGISGEKFLRGDLIRQASQLLGRDWP